LPERELTNRDVIELGLDTTDEWVVGHTGIRARRVAAPEQATSDLAAAAAGRALESAGVRAEDLGFLLCATSSPDHLLPATSSLLQHKLGADCGAMDLNSGCSGFVSATALGFAMFEQLERLSGTKRPVLVVAADTYSRIMNWKDRRTAVFFGDGAGAIVIGPCGAGEGPRLLSFIAGSDGAGGDCIIVPTGGSRERTTHASLDDGRASLHMDGRAVWEFAVGRVPKLVSATVAQAGLSLSDVALVVPHQANARMLDVIAAELRLPRERFFSNVERYGNTASASVGIALDEAVRAGAISRGQIVVLVGFGAGLAWSAACLRW
jgi:3-oxoacyl-[acyl-carrier-protein] synthase-3